MEDIAFAAKYCKRQRRVFLCDGDALIIPQKRLLKILKEIKTQLPWVTRVGLYANAKAKHRKRIRNNGDAPSQEYPIEPEIIWHCNDIE